MVQEKNEVIVHKDDEISRLIAEKCLIEQQYQDTRMLLNNAEAFLRDKQEF